MTAQQVADTVRGWCRDAGLNGADLDTAYAAWLLDPASCDGVRVDAVVRDRLRFA